MNVLGFIKNRWRNIFIITLLLVIALSPTLPAFGDIIRLQAQPALNDLTDVNAPTPSDSDVLTWNDALSQWVNAAGGSINLTDLQDAVAIIQADLVVINADLLAINNTLSEHIIDIGVLQGDVSTLQTDVGTLQSDLATLNSTVSGLVSDIGDLQSAVSDLQGDVSGLLSDVGDLQGDVSDLQGNVSALQSTVSGHTTDIGNLQSDVSDLQGAVSDLEEAVSDLESRMNAAEGDIGDLQSDVVNVQGNITGLKEIAIIYVIDGGGSAITTGEKGHLDIPFDCTITTWTLLGDQSGSIVIDVWKDTYANFPPTVADTIAGSEKPTLSAGQKNQDLALGTWTTSISGGDVLAFNVDSCSTVTRVTLMITATRVI